MPTNSFYGVPPVYASYAPPADWVRLVNYNSADNLLSQQANIAIGALNEFQKVLQYQNILDQMQAIPSINPYDIISTSYSIGGLTSGVTWSTIEDIKNILSSYL